MDKIEEKENELIRRANQGDGICFEVTRKEHAFLVCKSNYSQRDMETNECYWRGLKLVAVEELAAQLG